MIASIRHITKDRILFAPGPGCQITMFDLRADGMEALVCNREGDEVTRLKIAPATENQVMEILRNEDGSFEVCYHAV